MHRVRTCWDLSQEILALGQGANGSVVNISWFSAVSGYQTTPVILQFHFEYRYHIDCAAKYKSQLTVCLVYRRLAPQFHCQKLAAYLFAAQTLIPEQRGWATRSIRVCLDTLVAISVNIVTSGSCKRSVFLWL